jgi:hypothetical protein
MLIAREYGGYELHFDCNRAGGVDMHQRKAKQKGFQRSSVSR